MVARKLVEAGMVGVSAVVLSGIAAALVATAGSPTQTGIEVPAVPQGIPKAKAALLQRERQAIIDSRLVSGPKTSGKAPEAQAPPTLNAGIINMHQGPFPATEFIVSNFWQGPIGSNWILVYAGARRNADGSVGSAGLRVYRESSTAVGGLNLTDVGTFLLPTSDILTIIRVVGSELELRSATGHTVRFDLDGLGFN